MSEFQEDMIFKNVSDEDARLLLDIMGKKSKTVKICTRELRMFDPTTFRPDIMLELDDEILLVELQSTKVTIYHNRRFLVYVAITDYNKKTDKEVNLCVFSTAEESKQIIHKINKYNEFKYNIISLSEYDSAEIINTINNKIEKHISISGKELLLYALVPLMEKDAVIEEDIEEIVNTLINLTGLTTSIKALVFGIEWLIVDKFVKDKLKRNILRDALGEKMTLIQEYGEDKKNEEQERIVKNQLESGMDARTISETAKIPLSRVKEIESKLKE